MKTPRKSLLLALLFCAGVALADGLTVLQHLTKTNSDTAVPVRLTTVRGQSFFKSATFYGRRDARTDNTGTVYLGTSSTNSTQAISIAAGDYVVINAPTGSYFDLYDFYMDVATANDGVVVIYSF